MTQKIISERFFDCGTEGLYKVYFVVQDDGKKTWFLVQLGNNSPEGVVEISRKSVAEFIMKYRWHGEITANAGIRWRD